MSLNATRPGLLVSVRSVEEARAALAGGADLIDVKEPTRGPLGRADADVIQAVANEVGDRVPVSAALGEWSDWPSDSITLGACGVSFVKWGLASLANIAINDVLASWLQHRPVPVPVAYADARRARSPEPELLARLASDLAYPAFMIDTAMKDGSTLIDWMGPAQLRCIRFQLAEAGVRVAFAGSLDIESIRQLLPLCPDWFAVRGAACVGGRDGTVSAERVRMLKEVIAGADSPTRH